MAYLALAAVTYGLRSPVSSTTLPPCGCGDISSQVWFIAWPEHALATGHNILYSSSVAYPGGINLMTNTAAPLLGFLVSPVTWLLGPVAAYNLVMRLSFAVSGIAMCFVLRRWTRWWPAAFAGGLLYAFSPFMFGQGLSHDFLTFVPLPPVMLALLDELVVRRRRPVRNGMLLGVVVTAQLLISPEVLVMTALLAAFGLVLLAARHPVAAWERAGEIGRATGAAVITGAVLAGYPLWMYFFGPYHVSGAPHPVSVLASYFGSPLSLVFPTASERFTISHFLATGMRLTNGGNSEYASYVGIPLLLLLLVILVRFRRDGRVLLFTLVAVAAWSVTLGRYLRVDRTFRPSIELPYDLLRHIPIVDGAFDLRYALIMYLALAVVLAVGLDRLHEEGLATRSRQRRARPQSDDGPGSHFIAPGHRTRTVACVLAGAIALAPVVPKLPYPVTPPATPPVFTARDSPIADGDVVLSFPLPVGDIGFNDQALLWQAVAHMRFTLIGFRGAVAGSDHKPLLGAGLLLPPYEAEHLLLWGLYGSPTPPPPPDAATYESIRTFLAQYHVDDVSLVPSGGPHWRAVRAYFTAALRTPPLDIDGYFVWSHVRSDLGSDT